MEGRQPIVMHGRWSQLTSIGYGICVHNFLPVALVEPNINGTTEDRGELNPHQISLEIGMEVYCFEVFQPSSPPTSTSSALDSRWFRGFVVSTSPQPHLPLASDLGAFPTASEGPSLTDEPQVSVGIFPASHVHIREQLEDAENRLAELAEQAAAPPPPAPKPYSRNGGRMEPLQEEDEEEAMSPVEGVRDLTGFGANGGTPSKARNRASVASFQGSRLSQYGFGAGAEAVDTRPPPPLPNLKCGDETLSGQTEPLVDEVACALREWAALLYTHLHRRDYALFESVRSHIDALHVGRKQLLANTLSIDETEKLRKEMVGRLVKGNVEQGLEVIVRHPLWGGLVDVDVDGEIENKAWATVIRMYAMQVSLAYSGTAEGGLSVVPPPVRALDPTASPTTSRRLSNSTLLAPAPPSDPEPTPSQARAKFYHVFLDVRASVANPCAPGETAELYFSLFSKTDARYVTEEFCVILNHNGAPTHESEGRFDQLRTLFIDLSQHDVQDQIFLVCRIIKNGNIKLVAPNGAGSTSPNASRGAFLSPPAAGQSETASFDSSASNTGVDFGLGTRGGMLTVDGSGRQSYRRPFGCAVLEISQFNKSASGEDDSSSSEEHHMPIFTPMNESNFSTLHEDIIGSRIKEIEKSPRADHVAVNVRILYGEAADLVREMSLLLSDVPLTNRLGFSDVVFPDDERNEVYLKLWSGDFNGSAGPSRGLAQIGSSGARNIEVTAEIRTKDGSLVDRVLSRGTGEPNVTQYTSMVFRANNAPTWGELVKLEVPVEMMEIAHVFFTFRARGGKDRGTVSGTAGERPFAFAYFPLFRDNSAFQTDGAHALILYRYDRSIATPATYFQAPSTYDRGQLPPLPQAVAKTLQPLKDTMVIRTFLVSTRYTQNETLLKLLRWETELLEDLELLKETLVKVKFCSEVEVCKFLRDIFDALFGILNSAQNHGGEVDDLVFQALVTILGIVADRRFTNFKPVLDVYIDRHFTNSRASSHIIKSLLQLLRSSTNPEAATTLRSSIKVWHHLFKFVVRSREIQRAKDVGMGVTSDHLEATFKRELSALLSAINLMMRSTTPSSIIGTQTLAVQHFASILPDLAKCFSQQELADIAISFCDAVTPKGKIAVWKLVLENQLVNSIIFATPTGRAALVPNLVRWIKPALGKFDEHLLSPKDSQATRDNARVSWIEGIRLAVGVIASMLDVVQQALIDPAIQSSRALLGQEQDNIEYLLGILPRLLDSYREVENLANLDSVERQRSQASVVAAIPVIFPSSYPFSLLSHPPEHARREQERARIGKEATPEETKQEWPTLRAGMGEIACVFIALLHLAPRKIFVNSLESTLEVEGKDNFARLLTQIFRVGKSILENDAFPADWLNINILTHRVIVKIVDPIADFLEREFIPAQQASYTFNTSLWRDFFGMLLRLLASPQLLIEEFSPQKRRAVWRLAGDIRGEGAKTLIRLWDAIGWPEERQGDVKGRSGGYQVQFVPGLVEDVLSLCLSHHDELRRNAVHVLYSMIISEYYLNDDFSVIEAEVIDRLDKLFMSQTKGDEISRAFFVSQLRTLFDESVIDDRLRQQVDAFLSSVNSFLDLLLAVRNLPEGEEYQEDRIISTLKLMSFIKALGRSEVFIRYVQRLVTYHVALGNETEAGLTLKLHADLHEWNLTTFVDAIPDLDLPRQTEFARKETLYMRVLDHLSKGKAWETAIAICKELQYEYETRSFSYSRLSELLVLQSELYGSILKADRHFGEFFRVAFYGTRFPVSVSGKQFVYRGAPLEKLGGFIERMLNKHPGAQLLKTSTIPSEDIQFADAQYLQITSAAPEPDQESLMFNNPDVPQAIRAYYEQNDIHTFSFTRPVSKDSAGRTRVDNDFTSSWTEKTVLICEDSFPTVLRRSEVVEIRIIDISPIENALNDVESKKKELENLERRYHALRQTLTDRSKVNTNVLSMSLNGIVDTPSNQGVPMYRKAFLGADYMAVNPDKAGIIKSLEVAIDELVFAIARCLKLHAALCPPEMAHFHDTLERFFEKNFSDEIARLPSNDSAFDPPPIPYTILESAAPSPAIGVSHPNPNFANRPTHPGTRSDSISISINPSLHQRKPSVSAAAANDSLGLFPSVGGGGHKRRESNATVRSTATVTPSRARQPSFSQAAVNGINGGSTASLKTPSIYSERALDPLSESGGTSPTKSTFSSTFSFGRGSVSGESGGGGGAPTSRRGSLMSPNGKGVNGAGGERRGSLLSSVFKRKASVAALQVE